MLEEELERVRQEDTQSGGQGWQGDPVISRGLQGDAIQPLTIRVNQGNASG